MTSSLASSSLRGDEESRAFLQDRLAFLTRIAALFFLALASLRTLALLGSPSASDWALYPVNAVMLGVACVYAAAWLVCRARPRAASVLRATDAAALVAAGLLIGALPLVPTPYLDTSYPTVIATSFLLFARAVIVPSSAGRTLAVSAAAAVPTLAGIAFHARARGLGVALGVPGAMDAVIQAVWTLLAIALAALASRVSFGLRAEVRAARRVGQYTLEDKLGEGGMGVVYRGRHALLKRPTAVKLLLPEKAGSAAVQRFEREVQLTARLSHPNTVAVYDYGRTLDGVFYYAMELLEGLSLEALVARDGPQPPGRVVHILKQVCGALVEAHALGIVHRDIKPANVFLCERGGIPDVAKLLDFGLVKDVAREDVAALTGTDVVLGTPLYMAPEAVTAPHEVGPRSDLYAVGALGYFLLAGSPVFGGRNAVEVLGHHLHTKPERPSERLGRPLPRALEDLLLACLAKDPSERPASARELALALERLEGVEPWTEDAARAWWPPTPSQPRAR